MVCFTKTHASKTGFDLRAILPVLIMFVVTAVETVGDISGVMEGGMSREATDQELSGGVICDGIGSSILCFIWCFTKYIFFTKCWVSNND